MLITDAEHGANGAMTNRPKRRTKGTGCRGIQPAPTRLRVEMTTTLRIPAGLLLAAAAAGPLAAQPAPDATPTPIVAGPVHSPGNADWASGFEEARSRAAGQQKFVFVELTKRDCGNCQRMDSLLYPAFDFEALLIPMVPVKLDWRSPEAAELARRFEIGDVPAILIVTPEGRLVFEMQGFRNAPDFYGHVHRDLDAYRSFARRVEAQDVPKLSAREALDTGRELYQRKDPGAALPRLDRAGKAPDATAAIRDEALELEAAVKLDLGQIAGSRQTIEKLLAKTKDRDRRERAEIFRAQIPLAENRPADALALFRAFRKEHPTSKYAAGVDEMIRKLEESRRP